MHSLNNSIYTPHRNATKTPFFANNFKLNFANFLFRSILFCKLIVTAFIL